MTEPRSTERSLHLSLLKGARRMLAPDRQISASTFNAFVAAAQRLGFRDAVRRQVPPAVAALMDRPPLATTPLPGALLDDFYRAVVKATSRDSLRQMSVEMMRGYGGPLLKRLIDNALQLYGRTPASLFTQIEIVIQPLCKGLDVTWQGAAPTSGSVVVHPGGQPDPLTYVTWEGIVEYLFEPCGVPGVVGHAILSPDGKTAHIPVSW